MRTTFKMMGLADYITLTNALFGSLSIMFIILAVDDLRNPYQTGIRSEYLWSAQLCIIMSIIGDIIDGPVARKYSKQQLLGGSLDIMSDCLSFAVAPSLLIFVLFGRMGEATPLWTFGLALACGWVIATGMLRLARFEYESGSSFPWFTGLSSPANAILLLSLSSFVWLQPSSGIGPGLTTWECNSCWGMGENKPWGDFLIFPVMLFSGAMMISDRRLSKLKGGIPMWLSVISLGSLLAGTILQLRHTITETDNLEKVAGIGTLFFFGLTFTLTMTYIIAGPRICQPLSLDISSDASE